MKELIQLPPLISPPIPDLQETYGSKDWNIFHIFRYYRGYYTGEVRDLFPQSTLSEAQMSAELAGEVEALAIKAENIRLAGNLEWACALLTMCSFSIQVMLWHSRPRRRRCSPWQEARSILERATCFYPTTCC